MIDQRPAEVAERAVPGHWEGDLVMAWGSKTLIRSRGGLVVLVDEPTEQVPPADVARVDRVGSLAATGEARARARCGRRL